jgi:hypothetical protein
MNERIRELELEAIAYADSKVPVNDRYNDIYHSIVRGKFAELIVKECARIVDEPYDCKTPANQRTYRYPLSGETVLEHFGVE